MSKYEDYNSASRNYDNQRFAMGSDVMAAMIQFHCGKPLKDLHVLDAGCGTGNYAKALIDYGVGQVTLLDASPGMLEKAKVKLADAIESGKIKEVVEATMPPIPFPDASFDAVMFNLVLHHLEENPDGENFPTIEKALTEARRVLKPKGVLEITSGAPPRVYDRLWFVHLNQDIAKRHVKHYPHDRKWHEIFRKCGFNCVDYIHIYVDIPEHTHKALLDPEGPLKKEWRDCNSYWASATEEDLKVVEEKINEMKSAGTLEKFVETKNTCQGFYALPMLIGKPQLAE
ncbi:ubiquinone/menaquinone biosynthesis C-methyltransferase UbiE-like isoform X2 [Mercenaria mercenaria]|uniref:ubiquinone/menaquinone biosynthesis C-methyltransferase UbiE-like isoform X2 n=1 Tax=Mercenaria mercenaria TaxID=6596 RepID=UPI00234F5536|nr:ubiquinone/menaquinone biosynthesis C-methyltransferase UbiE-like isoform X2 [Mercenaria mercenaria]